MQTRISLTALIALIALLGSSIASANAPATQPAFPESWIGHWKGPMIVNNPGGAIALKMELIISKTDDPKTLTWTIVYDGPQGRQERPYKLLLVDLARGKYTIDEGNSILIDARLLGDALVSAFEVEDNRIVATYRLTGDELSCELVTTREKPTTTGGKDGIPEVKVLPPVAIQRAVMKK